MKEKIMNNIIFKLTKETFFEKIQWENKEFERRHKKLAKKALIYFGIPTLLFLIADQVISGFGEFGALGILAILPGVFFFMAYGILEGLELAEKIMRKQQ